MTRETCAYQSPERKRGDLRLSSVFLGSPLARAQGSVGIHAAPAVCVGIALLLGGCRPQPPAEPVSVIDTAERGPFKLSVEVRPKQVWIGDRVIVDLRVETPDEHVVQFP
ncbi:MAG: hypothetical protein KKI02_05160, partial [Planctomycetes bacterium]|nr:hypothetical protein [Planctomycetota bacterium]